MGTEKSYPFSKRFIARRNLVSLLLVLLWPTLSSPQQRHETNRMEVPEELQVPIFLKILTYDRSFETRAKDTLRIGILYFPDDVESERNKDAMIESLKQNKNKTINGVPFCFHQIEFISKKNLDKVIKERKINVLYVTSDSSNFLEEIIQTSQKRNVLTMTGRVDYVSKGISVGLGVKDQKPQIVINLRSAKAEGSNFSANLLRLCKVIK